MIGEFSERFGRFGFANTVISGIWCHPDSVCMAYIDNFFSVRIYLFCKNVKENL